MTGIGVEDGKVVLDINHLFEKTNIDSEAKLSKFLVFRRRRVAHRRDMATPASSKKEKENESEPSSDSSSTSSESHSSSSSSEDDKAEPGTKAEVDEIIGPREASPGNTRSQS